MPEHDYLQRALTPWASAALLAGTVIGTGIFLVPATMARETGSITGVFLVWIIGGLLSLCGALTYAELGSALPEAGGEYAFLRRAYGPAFGFLFGWQQIVIGKTGSIAAIGLAASAFMGLFVDGLHQSLVVGSRTLPVNGAQAISIAGILALTGINLLGVSRSGTLQVILTSIKLLAILGLCLLAFASDKGDWGHFLADMNTTEPRELQGLLGYSAALAAALWAFDGWNNLTLVSGEIETPNQTIPRVLTLGVLAVAGIYVITNIAYFLILPFSAVGQSSRVAQDVAHSLLGEPGAKALTIAALISTLAALNGSILSGARIFYAMARDGLFVQRLARVNPVTGTPSLALLFQASLASALILILGQHPSAFERVLDYALFGTWAFYGLTALAVIVLRIREPNLQRPYRTLGYPVIPLIFSAVAISFCLSIGLRRPDETQMGLLLLLGGVPVYLLMRFRNRKVALRS